MPSAPIASFPMQGAVTRSMPFEDVLASVRIIQQGGLSRNRPDRHPPRMLWHGSFSGNPFNRTSNRFAESGSHRQTPPQFH